MTKTLHGKVRGRTIELDEDPGVDEGQTVEIQLSIVSPISPEKSATTEGLSRIYEILGERYDSGFSNVAERHNEHQP